VEKLNEFLVVYFLQTGLGWAAIGGAAAMMFGCVGSAMGIRIAAAQGAGVLSEKPDLFGKLLVLMALPGTQGFYAFICMMFIAASTNLIAADATSVENAVRCTPVVGIALMFVGTCVGIVQWWSARYQGEASAAAINLVGKQPDQAGRAILLPALVETYALVALLAGILMTIFLTKSMLFASPALKLVTEVAK